MRLLWNSASGCRLRRNAIRPNSEDQGLGSGRGEMRDLKMIDGISKIKDVVKHYCHSEMISSKKGHVQCSVLF